MIKNLLFTLSATLLLIPAFAQELTFSKAQDFNPNKEIFEIGGWVQDRLSVFYTEKKKSYLDLYDANMDRKAIITLNFMPSSPSKVKLLSHKLQTMLLFSAQINNKEVYYAARLDKDAKIVGKPKSIDEATQDFFGNVKKDYQFINSSNNSKAGVFSYKIKDSKLECQINLIDDSLNIIHSSTQKIPTKNFYDVTQVILKNDGRLIVLMTDLNSNKNNEVAEAMVYEFNTSDIRKAQVKAYPFNFDSVFTANLFLKEDYSNDNHIYFAGLSKSEKGRINGLFSGTIDLQNENNAAITGKMSPFSASNMASFAKKDGFTTYIIRDLIVKNDGGMLLITEAYGTQVKMYSNSSTFRSYGYYSMAPSTVVDYLYGNILLLDIDANQNINWESKVEKWQRSVDDYGMYSSYTMLNAGDFLAFVYNGYNNKTTTLQSVSINANGEQTAKDVIGQKLDKSNWIPKLGVQTRSNELVLPVLSKNKLQFAKLNY